MTKEEIYDQQISPLMTQIIEICKEHQIGLHSTFFTAPEDMVTTHLPVEGDALTLKMLFLSAYCQRNLDLFFINLSRFCKEKGIDTTSAMILNLLKTGN